ncbi:MAG: TonB family protein [Thermoanaerobaculia bacterium]
MNTRDQFGNYLLLKKLAEDPFGETFRAGRIGKQGVERVVLLRVFNGQGLDGERLAQRLQARLAVQQALKSPNLGLGVDLGQVRGVPFLAYDYISGKTLAALAEQASKKRSPIPLDHALLITERIALGLAVAYETRVEDERVMHGFLTPHLVVVSNEGELRTVGFEASAGLREFAGHPLLKESVGRYLSPEALAGSPVAKTDDVYSMGALLYELLTGQKVPMNPPNGFGPVVDQAVLAFDGSALHPDLGNLLKRSLGARDQRIADVVTWHKTLAKMMFDGQYNPTTFNLAFFMHNLFREEIERETQELELESTTQIPLPKIAAAASAGAPAAPAAAGRPAAAPAAAPTFGMGGGAKDAPPKEDTAVLRDRYGLETPKASSKNVIFAAAAGGVVVLAVLGYLLFGRGGPSAAPAPAAPNPAPTAPAGPTPEEIQAQIAKMVEEKLKMSSQQYEDQLKSLQKQLEDARKTQTTSATPASAAAVRPTVPAPTASEPPVRPAPTTTSTTGTNPSSAAPAPAPPATSVPKPAEPVSSPAPPESAEPKVEPVPAPAAPASVQRGDMVTMGAGVVPPRVTRKGNFRYPPLAQRMKKEAVVTVRVLVDENGRVVDVESVPPKAGYGMDEAAIEYARSCGFSPPTKTGIAVRMWTDLKVAFTLGRNG